MTGAADEGRIVLAYSAWGSCRFILGSRKGERKSVRNRVRMRLCVDVFGFVCMCGRQ